MPTRDPRRDADMPPRPADTAMSINPTPASGRTTWEKRLRVPVAQTHHVLQALATAEREAGGGAMGAPDAGALLPRRRLPAEADCETVRRKYEEEMQGRADPIVELSRREFAAQRDINDTADDDEHGQYCVNRENDFQAVREGLEACRQEACAGLGENTPRANPSSRPAQETDRCHGSAQEARQRRSGLR